VCVTVGPVKESLKLPPDNFLIRLTQVGDRI